MAYSYPLQSLQDSCWFKLICGASFQHLPAVRNLTLAYALAGADCIDVAADPAVVAAARDGIRAMEALVHQPYYSPWLMVSVNDGEDPHFRKVEFDPQRCPPECDRPCERICPAQAIVFPSKSHHSSKSHDCKSHDCSYPLRPLPSDDTTARSTSEPIGVLRDCCYGCGRCIPVCPIQQIEPQSHVISIEAIATSLLPQVDAIEIHTQIGHTEQFRALWHQLRPHIHHLKLVAVSCPDGSADGVGSSDEGACDERPNGGGYVDYVRSLYAIMTDDGRQPLPGALLWQTDGRPMSGDIGKGTTHAAVRLAQKAIAAQLPGFIQLAGGTNAHTVPTLRSLGLHPRYPLAGVAYGSYARKILAPVLDVLEGPLADPTGDRQTHPVSLHSLTQDSSSIQPANIQQVNIQQLSCSSNRLETVPELLREAVHIASSLVSPLKALTPEAGATAPIAATISVPMTGNSIVTPVPPKVGTSVHL